MVGPNVCQRGLRATLKTFLAPNHPTFWAGPSQPVFQDPKDVPGSTMGNCEHMFDITTMLLCEVLILYRRAWLVYMLPIARRLLCGIILINRTWRVWKLV